jgi:hypothetical protein
MHCAYTDVDIVNGDNATQTDIVYRPRYYLSGYNSTAKRWRDEYSQEITSPDQRIISFKNLQNLTWSQLGISEIENDDDVNIASESEFEVTLTYTGICPFDVKRGLWWDPNSPWETKTGNADS